MYELLQRMTMENKIKKSSIDSKIFGPMNKQIRDWTLKVKTE